MPPEHRPTPESPDQIGIELRIKAVPGASRDVIAGMLGDRLKVRVRAAPEGGRANRAIIALLSRELGLKRAQVELVSGHAHPEKTFRLVGADARAVRALLDR
jgi:uncharacterized protein